MANKTSKYFKYAVGEIILVVIGILIALQINNWNEYRVTQKTEIKILQQLNNDLKKNLDEIYEIRHDLIISCKGAKRFLNYLNGGKNNVDSIPFWVSDFDKNPIFNNANTTYKNIENSNKSYISNDSLRLRITLMYEREFSNIKVRERISQESFMSVFQEQQRNNFVVGEAFFNEKESDFIQIDTPLNLESLKQNNAYKNILMENYNFRKLRLRFIGYSIERLKALIKAIDKEILELQ